MYAEGSVSVYIFKVGIRGEIIFTMGLNLHEDHPQDGKLRIEEIVSKIFNPICLFDVEGKIEAALSAFVKIDLFITSVEFSIQIVKITLLEFNLDVCNAEPPVLATRMTVAGDERLVLHMGLAALEQTQDRPGRDQREVHRPADGVRPAERQDALLGLRVRDPAGLLPDDVQGRYGERRADRERRRRRRRDLAARRAAPKARRPTRTSRSRRSRSRSGPTSRRGTGDDEITTGEGDDNVDGDREQRHDLDRGRLPTRSAAEPTATTRSTPAPATTPTSTATPATTSSTAAPGRDKLFGDADNDIVSAGPGDPAATPVDELIGGAGNDTLNADGGADKLWGDENLTFDCTATADDDRHDDSVRERPRHALGAAGTTRCTAATTTTRSTAPTATTRCAAAAETTR